MKTTHLTPSTKDTAGTQPLRRLAAFLSLAALLLLTASAALGAHAAVASHKPAASHACRTTQVTLHGNAAPTVSCLDGQPTVRTRSTGGSSPLASLAWSDYCYDDALALYSNSGGGGFELCISGSGVLNLNQSYNGVYWNDIASSFWTGCFSDVYSVDINRGGATAYASGSYDGENSPFANFPYQNVPNDALSSVYQFASAGGDTC